jgi:hypothetical protein
MRQYYSAVDESEEVYEVIKMAFSFSCIQRLLTLRNLLHNNN